MEELEEQGNVKKKINKMLAHQNFNSGNKNLKTIIEYLQDRDGGMHESYYVKFLIYCQDSF